MIQTTLKRWVLLITPLILLLALACSNEAAPDVGGAGSTGATSTSAGGAPTTGANPGANPVEGSPAEGVSVVAANNIVADWARAVGKERVGVSSLLPANTDPHTYQPGAQDVAQVADADLVLTVGLSLDSGWLDDLLQNAAQDPRDVVALAEYVNPIEFADIFEEGEEHGDQERGEREREGREEHGDEQGQGSEADDHGAKDPHFWLDPLRVKRAVNAIADHLATVDPDGAGFYRDNAAAYNRELDQLHTWIQGEVAKLPQERRLLVTSHDSFQYFAQRYGFQVVGAVMPAVTTDREPTAQELATLVETIEREGVPAVFAEKSHSQRLAKRIAEETGAQLIGGLYTGSLGEAGGEAGAYLDLMRYNVRTIVEALQ